MNKKIAVIIFTVLLVGFTTYISLDTFVIPRSVRKMEEKETSEIIENETTEKIVSDNMYQDDNIKITLTQYREHDTDIYVADVEIASPELLSAYFAKGTYGKNIKQTTSDMAESVNAILAINGDYYGAREAGFVVRNGEVYRSTSYNDECLVVYRDGNFEILNEKSANVDELMNNGAYHIFSFGPGLIKNGEIAVSKYDEVDQATTSNPRTAIAMIEKGHYLFVTSDGRTDESEGLSLYEMAEFLQTLGAKVAYNLDGGGSTTMYFNGRVVNNPVNHGSTISERKVSDIIYIGY